VINAGRKEDEKLPDFYFDLKRASEEMDPDNGSETSGDEDDPDFVDSDYEVDAEDDDLFIDNVDEGVTEGVATCNKFSKRKKSVRFTDVDADTTDREDLELPDSDGEGEVRMRFQSFRDSDMSNHRLKVGMVFDFVVVQKRAITKYSVKERVDIRYPRNEKKRLHVVCDKDCS
jgi:hypothetical protein